MVCSMENESIGVLVRDGISGIKEHRILLTPSTAIDSIFKEVSKEFDYNIDDICLVVQLPHGTGNDEVSTICFLDSTLDFST